MSAALTLHHPNVPAVHSRWSEDQRLHVAVAYSNPFRWKKRRELFNDFRHHISNCPNVVLYVGEVAFGDRPFEVTHAGRPNDFQWRTDHELWIKECALNLIVRQFAKDWKYGAYTDGDIFFGRHDWALETVHLLQHYQWLQLFNYYTDLGPNQESLRATESFASRYVKGELPKEVLFAARTGKIMPYCGDNKGKLVPNTLVSSVKATGLGWAFRRSSFEKVGGLLDVCILGSGDWHMAFGLVGEPDQHPQTNELDRCGKAYADAIKRWQTQASKVVKSNVGCLECHVLHNYHGSKSNRNYANRWKILRDHDFDPHTDIHRDFQGLWQLTEDKPGLRDDIRKYFLSRREDG